MQTDEQTEDDEHGSAMQAEIISADFGYVYSANRDQVRQEI